MQNHIKRHSALTRSPWLLAATMLGLLTACGGSSNSAGTEGVAPFHDTGPNANPVPPPPAPPPVVATPSAPLNDSSCPLQYSLTETTPLSGMDPMLTAQWHLNSDGTVAGTTPGQDLRVFGAWLTTRGKDVRVAVIDDAIELTHHDLVPNMVAGASYNYRAAGRGNAWPLPCVVEDSHGTSVAGLVAARDFNGIGVAGVAPHVGLVGYNALTTSSDTDIAEALNRDLPLNSVYNNSWGSADDGFLHPANASFIEAIDRGIATGRNGKGAIYVFPSGNGGCYAPDLASTPNVVEPCIRENSNYDGYVNRMGTITACAVNGSGTQPFYGERGANMLVCAPSSDESTAAGSVVIAEAITTTAIEDKYRSDFSGTSASTPMISGVAALMLATNPELTWRDVRLILASTARKNAIADTDWTTNFGLNFSHKYGFGVANAEAAVQASRAWTSVGGSDTLVKCGPYSETPNLPLLDPTTAVPPATLPATGSIIPVAGCTIGKIEFVEVKLTATHAMSGDLRVRLTSPGGLVSELADARPCYNDAQETVNCGNYADFAFGSVRHMNEPVTAPPAAWKLEVTDMLPEDTGTFVGWSITFFGRP